MSYSPAPLPSPTAATINVAQSSYTTAARTDISNDVVRDTSTTQSPSSAVFIIIIVFSSAILILAFIYLLIRCLHIRQRRTSPAEPLSRERINSNCFNGRTIAAPKSVLDSLPLFSFGTATGNLTGGDCAVCLSKFEYQDQLRLLPLCCHAFHARCIDTWLTSHMTCPLCRSSANPTDSDVFSKILSTEAIRRSNSNGSSFRIEIGNISLRRETSDSGRRSFSIGQFEYIVNDGCEIPVDQIHRPRGLSEGTVIDKETVRVPTAPAPHGERLMVEEVGGGGGRSWLRDYVDRLGSLSFSTRTLSIRSSGRFFTGSSRRSSDDVLPIEDLEANRIGDEISELFRWLSGV